MLHLGESNIHQNWRDYSAVIRPGLTEVYFAGASGTNSHNGIFVNSDGVVYVANAYQNISNFFGRFNIQVSPVFLGQTNGHLEDMVASLQKTAAVIQQRTQHREITVFDNKGY